MFVPVYGRWAVTLFALSLGIGCFGAAVEITLNAGYVLGQAFGWTWGIDKKRRDVSRFVAAFSFVLLLAVAIATIGFDPLRVTLISVALDGRHHAAGGAAISRPHERSRNTRAAHQWPAREWFAGHVTVLGALMAIVVIPLRNSSEAE